MTEPTDKIDWLSPSLENVVFPPRARSVVRVHRSYMEPPTAAQEKAREARSIREAQDNWRALARERREAMTGRKP